MAEFKTPGVYIKEKNAFPNSIVEVATAVPAFIGYTEKADNKGKGLLNKPTRITSLSEYIGYFGGPPALRYAFTKIDPGTKPAPDPAFKAGADSYVITQKSALHRMYYGMAHFFENGGGPCFIVSVGLYGAPIAADDLKAGIKTLLTEQEPTILVIPECVSLADKADCYGVQEQALMHCGNDTRSRVAILDVYGGDMPRNDPAGDCIENFRGGLNTNFAAFGAAYYPWLETSVVSAKDISFLNIDAEALAGLPALLTAELGPKPPEAEVANVKKYDAMVAIFNSAGTGGAKIGENDIKTEDDRNRANAALHESLLSLSPLYKNIVKEIRAKANLMPPSPAMAGVYTQVDNNRGVWKAPANVGVASVVRPAVGITHAEQEDLNATPQGKSVNAIRSFIGEGVKIWGARTLDGNSLDWRYVNVRRTMIFLEESCKLAAKAMVFEPNVSTTWINIKSMIENFLNGVWKRGGLMGAVPEDAYQVHVGLGDTMTPEDVLEGILRVTVLVAMVRPAEFIEITFQQLMPKS